MLKFKSSKQNKFRIGALFHWLIDWLFTVLRPAQEFSYMWRRHHCWWRAATFRHMLSAQGPWAGRDLYRATPAVTRDLGFFGLIRRTAPFSRLLRHTRGCGGSILTRILTGGPLELGCDESDNDIITATVGICKQSWVCQISGLDRVTATIGKRYGYVRCHVLNGSRITETIGRRSWVCQIPCFNW
jgi:hypothetical protein